MSRYRRFYLSLGLADAAGHARSLSIAPYQSKKLLVFWANLLYFRYMNARQTRLIIRLFLCIILGGCSQPITGPKETSWQNVPCEYRMDGDDESLLIVRAEAIDFDSAKIVLHSLSWTVWGDTLARQTTLFPNQCSKSAGQVSFTCTRPLPMNSTIRRVQLFLKSSTPASRRRNP
jgi:hypothetical protein